MPEWTVVVQQCVTHCVSVLMYFEITNPVFYELKTVPETFLLYSIKYIV